MVSSKTMSLVGIVVAPENGRSFFLLPSNAFELSFIRKRTHPGTQNHSKLQNPA
jgi:hypothetical protein